ncbi:MAG: hypothetical protein GX594_16885 [Pirellulaceae bacterium]|nr:hypothetical protein [Pirellulaceae bacterium]
MGSYFGYGYFSYGRYASGMILIAFIAAIVLLAPGKSFAKSAWQSDPLGLQAYEAYQGIDAEFDLDHYYGITNEDGLLGWGESYAMMGFVSMYEAIGQTAYLDRLVTHFDAVLSNRDDQLGVADEIRGCVMPAWSSTKYTAGANHAWLVHAGMITDPAARFVYLVNSTPSLQAAYASKAGEYEKAIRETVDAYDGEWRTEGDEGWYQNVHAETDDSPYNMQGALGRTMLNLWRATGEEKYRVKVEALANYMKNDLQAVGDRYKWKYCTYNSRWEDVSHGGIDVDFAFQCYQAGIVFNEADMRAFAETLKYMYQEEDDLFSLYVDGSGGTGHDLSNRAGYWGHLGFIDGNIRQLLADWYGEYVYGDPDSRWTGADVQCALAAAYLVETSPVPEPSAFALLLCALAGLLAYAHRRKQLNCRPDRDPA